MLTQIRTIEDIVEVLNSNPEIRTQLFEAFGLSALPGLYGRMDAFETTQQGILVTLKQQGEILIEHSEALLALRQDVTALNGRVDTMSVDVNTLKSVMLGNQVEDKAVNVIQSQLGTIVGSRVRRITLRYSYRRSLKPDAEDYTIPIEDACDDDVITPPELTRLMVTDLVFSGIIQGALHWFPVEVSNTIDDNDVARVVQTANVMERMFKDDKVVPLVAGTKIGNEVRQHAAESGVNVVTFDV